MSEMRTIEPKFLLEESPEVIELKDWTEILTANAVRTEIARQRRRFERWCEDIAYPKTGEAYNLLWESWREAATGDIDAE